MSDSDGSDAPDGAVPSDRGLRDDDADSDRETQGSNPTGERPAQLPPEAPLAKLPVLDSTGPSFAEPEAGRGDKRRLPARDEPRDSELCEYPRRPSILDALRQSRTTLHEVGEVAERLSLLAPGLADANKVVRQAVISFAVGLTLALLVTLVFAGGTWRLLLGILAGTGAATLVVFGALRTVSKLAARDGARELPGPAWLWVATVVTVAVAATAGFTFSVWEITKPATASLAWKRPAPRSSDSAASLTSARFSRADANMKRGLHVGMEDGVLYAPPAFESADGQFDLVIHYHGNVELVEQSIAAAKVNALVHIINFGEGAGSYSKPLRNPFVFDRMLGTIEARARKTLGLRSAQIRRIALSSWSAGFAALHQILTSRSRLDRVDAVLLMDGLHASYAPGSGTEVHPVGLKPFLAFARRAMSGQKLLVLTHSAIETHGYPSTTRTADALLEQLSLERQAVAPDAASPPQVDLTVAKKAFPTGERNWLRVVSKVHHEALYLYGCAGNGKGDHIAHLAQMSVTVLPPLRERWK
jgi:hypothetical protein